MAIVDPAIPKPPETSGNKAVDDYLQADSRMTQALVKDLVNQINWPTCSGQPTETPERIPMIKMDTTNNCLWVYYEGSWKKIVGLHKADHITGGADEIDGDKLDIDWNPSNYTPATTPAQVDNVDNLTAHLYGIDQAIGAAGGISCGYKQHLSVYCNGNTSGSIAADKLELYNSDGQSVILTTISRAYAITTSGADGLDTGSEQASKWYYLFIIWNGSTYRSLMSLSEFAPTLPGGYTHFRCVGEVYNDSSSNLVQFWRNDDDVYLAEIRYFYQNYTLTTSWANFTNPVGVHSDATLIYGTTGTSTATFCRQAIAPHSSWYLSAVIEHRYQNYPSTDPYVIIDGGQTTVCSLIGYGIAARSCIASSVSYQTFAVHGFRLVR